MVDYSINSRLNNGNNNVSIDVITIKSNLHKFTSILFVIVLAFGNGFLSFGMEKRVSALSLHQCNNCDDIITTSNNPSVEKNITVTKDNDNRVACISYGNGKKITLQKIDNGKIGDNIIFHKKFTNRIYVIEENGDENKRFKEYLKNNTYKVIEKDSLLGQSSENNQYIFASVLFNKDDKINKGDIMKYLLYCSNANSIAETNGFCGLFQENDAMFISILSSGDDIVNINKMFYFCCSLINIDLYNLKTHNVTKMNKLFGFCSKLIILGLSKFNTSKVTDMACMFHHCKGLKFLNLSSFNTTLVTDMSGMFSDCTGLTSLDLSNFNTENVENMSNMFALSNIEDLDLSNFKTEKVTHMEKMFKFCTKLKSLNLSNFNTENVTNMNEMFSECISLQNLDLSKLNTTKVTDMREMFNNCLSLKYLNISNFNIKKDTDILKMFNNCFQCNYSDDQDNNNGDNQGNNAQEDATLICSRNFLDLLEYNNVNFSDLLQTHKVLFFSIGSLFHEDLNLSDMLTNNREMGLKIASEQIPSFLGCKIFDNNDKTKYKCTVKKLKSGTRIIENVTVYNEN